MEDKFIIELLSKNDFNMLVPFNIVSVEGKFRIEHCEVNCINLLEYIASSRDEIEILNFLMELTNALYYATEYMLINYVDMQKIFIYEGNVKLCVGKKGNLTASNGIKKFLSMAIRDSNRREIIPLKKVYRDIKENEIGVRELLVKLKEIKQRCMKINGYG